MPLDYEPAANPVRPDLYATKRFRHGGCVGGCLGAILGGVIVPIGVGIYCAVVIKDMGGPGFWPILAILGAIAGTIAGVIIGTVAHLCIIFWPRRGA